jgi:biotin operon repressor
MSQKARIIELLKAGQYESTANMARILDCPEPSVRRAIRALRADGHNISFAAYDESLYRLGV